MNVYTDPKLLDVAGALETLPALPLSAGVQTQAGAVKATGTDDSTASRFAPTSGKSEVFQSIVDKAASEAEKIRDDGAVAVSACAVKIKNPLTSAVNGFSERGRGDSNPQPPDRQSDTLTN